MGGVNLVLNCYHIATIDQDYAFNIYRAIKSGKSDDVNFDFWKSGVHSSLDVVQKSSSSHGRREIFEDECSIGKAS